MSLCTKLRAKSTQRKAASFLMLSLMVSCPLGGMTGCDGGVGFLGLQDYQRDFLFFAGAVAVALLADQAHVDEFHSGDDGVVGQPIPGQDGVSCWDLNGDGLADADEDTNGDGFFDAFDCQGATGLACWDLNGNGVADIAEDVNADGNIDVLDCRDSGSAGAARAVDGLNCWDLNGNRQADPAEDQNGDGHFDALDCRAEDIVTTTVVSGPAGPSGPSGPSGADGLNCWDTNGNGVGDEAEDLNQDGFFTALDCQVLVEAQGSAGLSCWDANENGFADSNEDINGDGFFDALDCQGSDGVDGAAGTDGADGIAGSDGLNCWDANGNGVADAEEDVDRDGFFTVLDCRGTDGVDGTDGADGAAGADGVDGAAGADGTAGVNGTDGAAGADGAGGLSCWDTNGNGVGDPEEDIDGDQFFTVMDCRGAAGVAGVDGIDGTAGADGIDGVDGTAGLRCWDTNGSGAGEQEEDLNGDGFFTAADCRGVDGADGLDGVDGNDGADGLSGTDGMNGTDGLNGADGSDGTDGLDGTNGLNCWDTNGNGIGDPQEDSDSDGFFTALDCSGADALDGLNGANGADGINGTDGIDGADGIDGTDGVDGLTGLSCWDLNGNHIGDASEDVSNDGFFNALDCQGADGIDGINGIDGVDGAAGADGADGVDGAAGSDGIDGVGGIDGQDGVDGANGLDAVHCWDTNGNGLADPNEDIDGDGFFTAWDCRGADGADGLNCWDTNGNGVADEEEDVNGDGVTDAADCRGGDGLDGANGSDGLNCWDTNGNGLADISEDINGDGVFDASDCRASENSGPQLPLFDIFIDDFFTVRNGTYGSLSVGDDVRVELIEEPALGPTEVVAFRTSVPFAYDDTGHDDPSVTQNTVNLRLFLWREGPVEDCFVVRLDAFRASHGTGVSQYGDTRYIKLDDPAVPDPAGTLIVVDLPLNNEGGGTTAGLGLPADLLTGDFLAFEINIDPASTHDSAISYTFMGVEFFETPPGWTSVAHATVFASVDDVDCHFRRECRNDRDCDDGVFCNGEETCSNDGQCVPGDFPCGESGELCDEVDDICLQCSVDIEELLGSVASSRKVMICHVPQGNPSPPHTLLVSPSAVDAHLDHGDSLGACSQDCPAIDP